VQSGLACGPNNLLSINATTLSIDATIPVPSADVTGAISLNQLSNMIYIAFPQNLLTIVNANNNQIIQTLPITAYTMTFGGISVNPHVNWNFLGPGIPSGEIFLSGSAYCDNQFSGCNGTSLYIFSTDNYGLFGTYVSPVGLGNLEFDAANNETYALTASSLLALKIPSFNVTILLP